MYTVYVLKSLKTGKRYIGYTNNFLRRFKEHNSSKKGFDYRHRPFEVIYRKSVSRKKEATRLERYYKGLKGNKEFIKILESR